MNRIILGIAVLMTLAGCENERERANEANRENQNENYEVRRTGGAPAGDRDRDGRTGLNEVGDKYDRDGNPNPKNDKDHDGRTGLNEIGDQYDGPTDKDGMHRMGNDHDMAGMPKVDKAVAMLRAPDTGKEVGTVRFEKEAQGLRVKADLNNVPAGTMAMRIAEDGDCSDPKLAVATMDKSTPAEPSKTETTAANPQPTGDMSHGGKVDLTPQNGKVSYDQTLTDVSFMGPDSIIGRAVVIEPTSGGNANQRFCGVIGIDQK